MIGDDRENPSPVASRPGTGGKVWKHVKTGGNKWKRVETTIRMGTGKVGKSCSRTPRKTENRRNQSAKNRKKREFGMKNDERSKAENREGKWRKQDSEVTDGR